jgi:UDP-N-acetylmuramoyl-tripeptide--D-alanyl-D-alanine ligase
MQSKYLWSGLGLVAPLNARVSGRLPAGVKGISIDTRTLAKGDLFFAIKGDNSDGHDYVAAAFEKGAAAAVVDEAHAAELRDLGGLYVVHDTLEAMRALGLAARARSEAAIAAVTGSVGKTSTKDALALVLGAQGLTHASAASYNNHWGVPLTLCRMPRDARFGVFEIGMNHAGEITPLVAMVRPHVAIITTIAPVHLEFFASIEAIADAKAEIFSGLEQGGTAILNGDIPQFAQLRQHALASPAGRLLTFGASEDADAQFIDVENVAEGSRVTAKLFGKPLTFFIGAPGHHMAMNALAVLLAVEALGGNVEQAARDLANFAPPKGRGERCLLSLPFGDFTLIDESYNANPTSMRAAIAVLGETQAEGRRLAVLGDMLELGPDGAALHAGLADALAASNIDLVFAAGPLMRHLFEALPEGRRGAWAATAEELEPAVFNALRPGDVVMIKASNGSRMGPIVAKLQKLFARAKSPAGAEG